MKGLLVKEVVNMRIYGKTAAILAVFFIVLGVAQQNAEAMASMLGCVVLVFSMMAGVNSMSFDTASKWDCYVLSMPIRRKDVVLSKYLFSLGFGAAMTLVLLALAGAAGLFFPELAFGTLAAILLGVYCACALMLSVLFPVLYRFGVEKARFIILAVALVPSIGGVLLGRLGFHFTAWGSAVDWGKVLAAVPFVVILLVAGSYFLSVRIFERKDL